MPKNCAHALARSCNRDLFCVRRFARIMLVNVCYIISHRFCTTFDCLFGFSIPLVVAFSVLKMTSVGARSCLWYVYIFQGKQRWKHTNRPCHLLVRYRTKHSPNRREICCIAVHGDKLDEQFGRFTSLHECFGIIITFIALRWRTWLYSVWGGYWIIWIN